MTASPAEPAKASCEMSVNPGASFARQETENDVDEEQSVVADDVDDQSTQDGSLSRCHNRSASHDSYFRLLVTGNANGNGAPGGGSLVDPVNEEGESQVNSDSSQGGREAQERFMAGDAIYAEISKPGAKSMSIPRPTLGVDAF